MKCLLSAVAFGTLLFGAQTSSARPESRAVIARQQLSECMSKRMSANRNLSYNDAMRTCKARLQPPKDLAAVNPIAAGTKGN